MQLWQSIVLGIVQGLTEFLPISSSGHLVLGQRLLGLTEPALMFDVAVHVGTLAAVIWVFREDLWQIARGLFASDREARQGRRLLWLVIIGSVPTALIGLLFKDQFEAMFSSLMAVGVALMITGCLLMASRLAPTGRRGLNQTGPGRALAIGLIQGLAITPGISRSGSTISLAMMLGMERSLAARYSFVLSIPAILGALLLQILHLDPAAGLPLAPMLAGGAAAAISGWAALVVLLRLVRGGKLYWFAYYCWPLGLAALAWHFWG